MPLPSDFTTASVTRTTFEPIEEGIYDAVLADVQYRGQQQTPWGPKDQIMFKFHIPEIDRTMIQSVNNSWSPEGKYQASGYYVVATALGIPKGETPPAAEQVNNLIGRPVRLVVKQVIKEDGTIKNKITDFVAVVKKGSEVDKLVNELDKKIK